MEAVFLAPQLVYLIIPVIFRKMFDIFIQNPSKLRGGTGSTILIIMVAMS